MLKLVNTEAGRKKETQEDLIRTKWLVSRSKLWQWLVTERSQCPVRDWPTLPSSSGNWETDCPLSDGFHVASVIRTGKISHWVCAGGQGHSDISKNGSVYSPFVTKIWSSLFLNPRLHSVSLIYAHSSHSTTSWSTTEAPPPTYFGVHTYLGINMCTNVQFFFPSYPLTQQTVTHMHVHTHSWSKVLLRKPHLANLCSCQSPADSCVSNVSQTVIRKSLETLKSLILLWRPRFLLCQIPLRHRSSPRSSRRLLST